MRRMLHGCVVPGFVLAVLALGFAQDAIGQAITAAPRPLARVTLEMSLKPFVRYDETAIAEVWRTALRQWAPLLTLSERAAVLFWTGDGQEILVWRGELKDRFDWARYIGFCNPETGLYPPGWAQSEPVQPYRPDAPVMDYFTLKRIVRVLRQVATTEFGLQLEVGTTFDPGPQFTFDDFRYLQHPEVMIGGPWNKPWQTLGFVNQASRFKADPRPFAGFPQGIPDGVSFGTFLGRQSSSFLPAMGFDYLWFSNGFGFTPFPWWPVGENFNGLRFNTSNYEAIAAQVLGFWQDFKREAPRVRIEARSHNYSVGVGTALHGIRLKDIYSLGMMTQPPPNPGWGARDLGMELTAQLSRIAVLPGQEYGCRFSINDPWFYTNPWWDEYNREPFGIYCPLALGRLNGLGQLERARNISIFSIDTEKGKLFEETPLQVIPHVRWGVLTSPDEPGCLVWLYPFEEFDRLSRRQPQEVGRAFFCDMYIRSAIDAGLPLNTVINSQDFVAVAAARPEALRRSVVVAPTPTPNCGYEQALIAWVQRGGQALLYGPLDFASPALLEMLNVSLASPVIGDLLAEGNLPADRFVHPVMPTIIHHRPVVCAGGVREMLASPAAAKARMIVRSGKEQRIYALSRQDTSWNGGGIAWIRGSVGLQYSGTSATPQWDPLGATSAAWMRYLLCDLGYQFFQDRYDPNSAPVVQLVARHLNGLFFTGFKPDGTASVRWRLPGGAPILVQRETRLQNGASSYALARSFHEECRVLVDQQADTLIACSEDAHPTGKQRRIVVTGLQGARVTLLPPREALPEGRTDIRVGNSVFTYSPDLAAGEIRISGVTGPLVVTW